jgi:predicted XRE-type DNA-binding protein
MTKRKIDGIEIETSSGNVFADRGLPNAEKLKIKSGLVIEITRAVHRLGLTQEEAGLRMDIPQPKVSGMMRGDFTNLSERKLMECLNRLGYDIEIKVRPAAGPADARGRAGGMRCGRRPYRCRLAARRGGACQPRGIHISSTYD